MDKRLYVFLCLHVFHRFVAHNIKTRTKKKTSLNLGSYKTSRTELCVFMSVCLCADLELCALIPATNRETNRRVSGITETLVLLETRLLTDDSCGFILRKCGGGLR